MAKIIPCQGKHREFGNFAKTQGIWFAQVVNTLTLKGKRYFNICRKKFPVFCGEAGLVGQFNFVYVIVTNHVNWHRENLWSDRQDTGN